MNMRRGQTSGAFYAMVAFGVYCIYKGKSLENFKQECDMLWFLSGEAHWNSLMTTSLPPGLEPSSAWSR